MQRDAGNGTDFVGTAVRTCCWTGCRRWGQEVKADSLASGLNNRRNGVALNRERGNWVEHVWEGKYQVLYGTREMGGRDLSEYRYRVWIDELCM